MEGLFDKAISVDDVINTIQVTSHRIGIFLAPAFSTNNANLGMVGNTDCKLTDLFRGLDVLGVLQQKFSPISKQITSLIGVIAGEKLLDVDVSIEHRDSYTTWFRISTPETISEPVPAKAQLHFGSLVHSILYLSWRLINSGHRENFK